MSYTPTFDRFDNQRLRAEIDRLTAELEAYKAVPVEALEEENAKLRAALERLVIDYQDVPDPTDADGQAVFEDARAALEETK